MIWKEEEKVFWSDPDDGQSSGVYTIVNQINDENVLIKSEHSEAEVPMHELMKLDEVYVCKECSSFDIEELMWCKLNSRKHIITDVSSEDRYYCNDCEEVHYTMPMPYLEYLTKNKKDK